jgi:hypothetical protein
MNHEKPARTTSRRAAITGGARALAAIGVVILGIRPVVAKSKAAKDDFYFQETPDDSGNCALLEGDVCTHCYCQGWTDKSDPKSKKAGT